MKNEKYTRLKEQVQKIEEKILAITGKNVEFNMEWTRSQRKREQVERLIWKRKHLLDKMFIATPEEVVRMEQVNSCFYDLTQKMYARTEAVYRKMAAVGSGGNVVRSRSLGISLYARRSSGRSHYPMKSTIAGDRKRIVSI